MAFVFLNLAWISGSVSVSLSCDKFKCPDIYKNDRWCDADCMTPYCNFDMSDDFDSSTNKTESDCYEFCTVDLGCSPSLLGNGICDEACSSPECGYDWGDCGYCAKACYKTTLENDTCDPSCNVSSCFYDVNLCAECSPGCTNQLFLNDQCDLQCRTSLCNYDNQLCPIDQDLCADGCYEFMKGDGNCDFACNNQSCDFDLGDCNCDSECFKTQSDSLCDEECNSKSCSFDFGDCGYCSKDCFLADLGDGECKEECNNQDCIWDKGDCVCSENCNLEDLGQCKEECLNAFCNYDEYPNKPHCGDSVLKHLAIYTQIIARDFFKPVNLEACQEKMCSIEDLSNALEPCPDKCCVRDCKDEECAFHFGMCIDEECGEDCEICGNRDTCLKCKAEYFQYLGKCFTECPIGTEANSFGFFAYDNFCVPYIASSSLESPFQYYVDTRTDSSYGTGTSDDPFSSISVALSSIYAIYSEIVLMSEGPFELSKTPDDYVFSASLKNKYDPLSMRVFDYQSIAFTKTGAPAILSVKEAENLMLFNATADIKMSNVIIEGKNIFPNCTGDIYCDYCPVTYELTKTVNDRGIELQEGEYFTGCSDYHEKNLFVVANGGNLELEDVTFENLRMELNSLIKSEGGNVNLQNVTFKNIRNKPTYATSAILFQGCSDGYNCGDFTYTNGTVSLVNNGFEYTEADEFPGFFYAYHAQNVRFEEVEFTYNIVYKSVVSDDEHFAMIRADIFYTMAIVKCKFANNIIGNGILHLDAQNLNFVYSIDEDNFLEQLLVDHVVIEDVEFSDNLIFDGSVINALYKNTLQNIYMSRIQFLNNFCSNELIKIENQKMADEYRENITMPVEIDGTKINAHYTKRRAIFDGILVTNNYMSRYGVIYAERLANIKTQNCNISNNIAGEATGNILIEQFAQNPETYMENEIESTTTIDCDGLGYFYLSYNLEIDSSLIQNNSCKEHTPTIVINNQDIFNMTNTSFLGNSGSSDNLPVCLYLNGYSTFSIENSVFSNNVNSNGLGPIFSSGSELHLEIKSTLISENQGTDVAGVLINADTLSITNVTFHKNTNTNNGEGAMVFEVSTVSPNLTISDSVFNENESFEGQDAALSVKNSGDPANTVLVQVSNTYFTGNKAYSYASAFYTGSSVNLNNLSYFENCTFSRNEVGKIGNIYLDHFTGNLEFKNCTFTENISDNGNGFGAVFFKILGEEGALYLTSSVFSQNRGTSTILFDRNLKTKLIVTRECEFSNNQGRVMHLKSSFWEDSNSVFFSNHIQSDGGAFQLEENSEGNLRGTHFLSNSASSGGAGILRTNSKFIADNCTFSSNSAEGMGGALFTEQDSELHIFNSDFNGNSAEKGSAVMTLACDASPSVIDGSVFHGNHATQEGTILILMGELIYRNSEIYGNTASTGSSGLSITTGIAVIEDSNFHDQESPLGTYLYSNTYSTINITSSVFSTGKTEGSGGALYSIFTNLTISSSSFDNLEAGFGGAIYLFYNSQLNLQGSSFTNIKAGDEGGVISSFESDIYISECEFSNYEESAVYLDHNFDVEVASSSFSSGTAANGAGLYCKVCNSLVISDSTFTGLSAIQGGAIFLYTHIGAGLSTFKISNSSFTSNQANNGGAIYDNSVNLSIENCIFDSNSATDSDADPLVETIEKGRGGGVFVLCEEVEDCEISIEDSSFTHNNATYNGGAIAWEDVMPSITSNSFESNNAMYGQNTSSFPIKIMEVDANGDIIHYIRRLQDTPVAGLASSVASGQVMPPVAFAVVDHYNQIVSTDNINTLSVSGSDGVSVSGTTQVPSVKGVANFTDLIVSAEPGTSVSVSIVADKIKVDQTESSNGITYSSIVSFEIELRECEAGEATVGVECQLCEEGKYSLDPSDTACINCPESKAFCYGGSEVAPKPNYWRSNKLSSEFWRCPNPSACEGGEMKENTTISYTGRCASGYKGNMCQSCDVGHSRGAPNMCKICPDELKNIAILLAILSAVIVALVIMVKTAIDSAYEATALHSVYIKIFINYVQLVMLTASFDLKWPKLVLAMFSIHETAGSVTTQLFSFDCYMDSGDDPDSVYYNKLIVYSIVPGIVILLGIAVWTIICLFSRRWNYMKEELVATLVIILFLMHPTIIRVMFSSMNCQEIEEGEYWLKDNLDIRCWDSTHVFYILSTSLPSIVLWGIFVPTFCLFLLIKNKKRLSSLPMRKKYGFLFNGYTKRGYYWEFVILYRKIIIICCSVFLGNFSISVQALTVMVVLILSLALQYKNQPYSEPPLNQMEVRSILVSSITIYCGLYYLTEDLNEGSKLFLFCIILIVNIYFIYIWAVKIFGATINHFAKKFRFVRRIFMMRTQVGVPDHILQVREEPAHVFVRENEKFYSLIQSGRKYPSRKNRNHLNTMKDLFMNIVNRSFEQEDYNELYLIYEKEESEEIDIVQTEYTLSQSNNNMFDDNRETT